MSSVLLALDTCTRRASIAVRDDTTLRSECTWECERQETALVSARIHDLMHTSHIQARDLGAVAVAIGPGSFTGVRCGLAIGKGLAMARGIPMIGVTAFDVIAHAQPRPAHTMPMLALLEAGRGRVAACRYEWNNSDGSPSVASDWWTQSWQELFDGLEGPMYVCGDIAPGLAALIKDKVTLASAPLSLRRAGFLAELAFVRWQRGETDDTMSLSAIYPASA